MADEKPEEPEEQLQIVHDDIVQRLLDYQRQLREGASPAEATEAAGDTVATDTIEVVDVAAAEAETETEGEIEIASPTAQASEAMPSTSTEEIADEVVIIPEAESDAGSERALEGEESPAAIADLSDRVAELETTLARLDGMVKDLRHSFQEMAIDADERLAALEDTIATVRAGAASE